MSTTTKHLVVLGAGTAGTMVVTKLRKRLPATEWSITVVDKDDIHDYQPGYLFIPFRMNKPGQIRKSKRPYLHDDVEVVMAEVERVDAPASTVHLVGGRTLHYDQLVIASGTTPRPDQTPGCSASSGTARSVSSTPSRVHLRCGRSSTRSPVAGWSCTSPSCPSCSVAPLGVCLPRG